ncbi:43699_t:CDS:1, partial [Gigaspora margarita]
PMADPNDGCFTTSPRKARQKEINISQIGRKKPIYKTILEETYQEQNQI